MTSMEKTASVTEAMNREPITCDTGDTILTAANWMSKYDIGDVMIVDQGKLYGILTDRDIVTRVLAEGLPIDETSVESVCTTELQALSDEATLEDAAEAMREHHIRRLPIVDADHKLIGVISSGDLAMARDEDSALAEISLAPAGS